MAEQFLRFETQIASTPAAAFDLARDIGFHTQSVPGSNERAVAGVTSGPISLGESVTFEAKHFGLPFRLTSEIVEMEPPSMFVDEQRKGPFKSIRHVHRFTANEGGTLMVDEITFTSPAGPVGDIVNRVFLTDYLRRLIETRNQILKEELERTAP